MKPAEVALIVDRKSFQEISLWGRDRGDVISHRKLGLSACIFFTPAFNLTPTKQAPTYVSIYFNQQTY